MALSDYQLRNSTEYGGDAEGRTVTYKYRPLTADWETFIPVANSTVVDGKLGTVYFQRWAVRRDENDDTNVYFDLEYSTNSSAGTIRWKANNADVYLPMPSASEEPLETHPDYLMNWNHSLYRRASVAGGAAPGFWSTDNRTTNSADGLQYLWSKDHPGDEWRLFSATTIPQKKAETWLVPRFAVQYQFWHETKANVEAVLQTIATRVVPGELFGYANDATKWLVTDVQIDEDGTKYRGTVIYTFSSGGWDTDLYPAG